ncbi:MAG TPA: succinyl-diaminopimelate desuccinylase [Segeticoccus sp.]|uniref:succinyl-diaminopimelate desuccinylase n=1 Tax=Segeticoccus sp. TaxID=2706531 RepID=UPI002D7F2822|nr:succinyl-diaminopimelate desuccinylase [Segeticoccus sp.]HET8599879.1 succinyl-diaminopimelate desuccinylase [Segeticoccus sp.]
MPAGMPSTPTTRRELDLDSDVVSLTAALCDIPSVSGAEGELADAVERALGRLPHLRVVRDGNTVVARTELGRPERVVLAGHLDTVPLTDPPNLPTQRRAGELWGRGTVDMKGGVAVQLRLAAELAEPNRDLTYLFYDCEEVEAARNGLARLARNAPELLEADFAVLLEPTDGGIEGGCKGTLRVEVATVGVAAHSARPWNGRNAIHAAAPVLQRLADYQPRTATVDGLDYHEALNAVGIRGGIAGNVIPDACVVTVNYRFGPDRTLAEAEEHVRTLFEGYAVTVTDGAEGARPGLRLPTARSFVEALALPVTAKQGWTDVARFSALGVPAVNFGPGDPNLAHHDEERCPVEQVEQAEQSLLRWLRRAPAAAST